MSQRLSRAVDAYKSPPPAACAARQWLEAGKPVSPGQVMHFVYTRGQPGVWAVGCGELDGRTVDVRRYLTILARAVDTVIAPFE